MTIHVNIGAAKTRLSELVAAAMRGEQVVHDKAGVPQVGLVPVNGNEETTIEARAARRRSAVGIFADAFRGFDIDLGALKRDRDDPEDRMRRKLAAPD